MLKQPSLSVQRLFQRIEKKEKKEIITKIIIMKKVL